MSDPVISTPVYPTWIKSGRIRLFWFLSVGIIASATALGLAWRPAFVGALLAAPFIYIAVVLSVGSYRLGRNGGGIQRQIHRLIICEVGPGGSTIDIGCGSAELLIRLAKEHPGYHVGLDRWGRGWDYTQARARDNVRIEDAADVELVSGSASCLPFGDAAFARVVSCLTFHEIADVPDKKVGVREALRVLEPKGRFVFVDLFDDPTKFGGLDEVLGAIADTDGLVETFRPISELLEIPWPLNHPRSLRNAVLLAGSKQPVPANAESPAVRDM